MFSTIESNPKSSHVDLDEKGSFPKCRGMLYSWDQEKNDYRGHYFVIQKDNLVCFAGRYKRKVIYEVKLRFTVLETLKTFPTKQFEYGFSIKTSKTLLQYYVAGATEFEQWFDTLRKLCYQQHFHEKYKVIREIDKGKTAIINTIERIGTGEVFAGKFIPKESFIVKPSRLKLVKNEIKALGMLTSSHILSVVEFFQSDTEIIIVTEFMSAGTLFSRLMTKKKYAEKEAAMLLRGLIEGLHFIHQQNLLHRDIKLENIFMAKKENDITIKIGDFDLACHPEEADPKKLFGTPGYIAPEIFNKSPGCYSIKSDIFSCGIVLYTLVLGSFPFKGKTSKELMDANRMCEMKLNGSKWKKLSPECQDLILRMLEVDPNARLDPLGVLNHKWMKIFASDESLMSNWSTGQPSKILSGQLNNYDGMNGDETCINDNDDYYILRKNVNIQRHRVGDNRTETMYKKTATMHARYARTGRKPGSHIEDKDNNRETRSQRSAYHGHGKNTKSNTILINLPEKTTKRLDVDSMSRNSGGAESNCTLHPFYKMSNVSQISRASSPVRVGNGGHQGDPGAVLDYSEDAKDVKVGQNRMSSPRNQNANIQIMGIVDSNVGDHRKPSELLPGVNTIPKKFINSLSNVSNIHL